MTVGVATGPDTTWRLPTSMDLISVALLAAALISELLVCPGWTTLKAIGRGAFTISGPTVWPLANLTLRSEAANALRLDM